MKTLKIKDACPWIWFKFKNNIYIFCLSFLHILRTITELRTIGLAGTQLRLLQMQGVNIKLDWIWKLMFQGLDSQDVRRFSRLKKFSSEIERETLCSNWKSYPVCHIWLICRMPLTQFYTCSIWMSEFSEILG